MKTRSMDLLYREYKNDVYRYLYSMCRNHHTAEDLMQETFYRALKHLDGAEGRKAKAWLLRVAHNAYIDKLRKESRSSSYENEFFFGFASDDTPEQRVLGQESRKELYALLSVLAPNQQHAVLLYDIHGFSYQEAADLMGISLSHFKILLYRARQKLRGAGKTA
ncbi:MAG: sigma-70 family RNA polymerase sigma factor [Paenibacillus macerans]|uniref:RNA polymerase sigma factor n=1 Tax=Paenibacillus macerans TaxID=44252 RepID=UPI0029105AF3|nr:sigma-70 family RNA polymerase sigma factor [Paenibacillus macerans]MDU7476281.1 sigma-70 family RNA polymerase sigma factor [Paenibacillus macerans]MEC0330956.1 sigma-70 family RNA polymerase sigma factor [Paenibacillus macerans]